MQNVSFQKNMIIKKEGMIKCVYVIITHEIILLKQWPALLVYFIRVYLLYNFASMTKT